MLGCIKERGQEHATEELINDSTKGGNPNINQVMERGESMDSLMY